MKVLPQQMRLYAVTDSRRLQGRTLLDTVAAALDGGADDYLTKPFSATELMARIRVALRHSRRTSVATQQTVHSVGGLSIDLERHLVFLDGTELHVTPMEYSLLSLLFRNMG